MRNKKKPVDRGPKHENWFKNGEVKNFQNKKKVKLLIAPKHGTEKLFSLKNDITVRTTF